MPVRILLVLAYGGMATATNSQVFGLLLSTISDSLGYEVSLIGGMRAISSVVAIGGAVVLTRYADQVPRKHLILLGFSLMLASSLLAASATNIAWFAAYFLVAGAGDVILFSMLLTAASDFVEGHALYRANGIIIGSFGMPGFLIVPIAGLLSDQFGWRAAYLMSAGIAMTAIVLTLVFLPRTTPTGGQITSLLTHIRLLVGRPGLRDLMLGNYLRYALYNGLLVYTAAFLINRFGLTDSRAGFFFGLGSASFLVAAMTSGYTLGRLGAPHILLTGGLVLVGAVAVAMLPGIPGIVTGVLLLVTIAFLPVQENGALGLILRGAGEVRGAAVSLNELGAGLGGITGAALGGLAIRCAGYPGLGIFLGIIALLSYLFSRRALLVTALLPEEGESPVGQVH